MTDLSNPIQKYPAPPFKATVAAVAGPRRPNGPASGSW
jgi:hypothetical protein